MTYPPVSEPAPVIRLDDVSKIYGAGETIVRALDRVSLTVERGEYLAIMGASGSGKSTMMHILGCLDAPTAGRYELDGIDVGDVDELGLAIIRNRRIGFVFQAFNLLPRTTARENVELPMTYGGVRTAERRRRAEEALEAVGLGDRMDRVPSQLSGGQQQRVALARALVTSPSLLLADEPTGNLDSHSTAEVLGVLDDLHRQGHTIAIVTHEDDVARHVDRIVRLHDGAVVEDLRRAGARS